MNNELGVENGKVQAFFKMQAFGHILGSPEKVCMDACSAWGAEYISKNNALQATPAMQTFRLRIKTMVCQLKRLIFRNILALLKAGKFHLLRNTCTFNYNAIGTKLTKSTP